MKSMWNCGFSMFTYIEVSMTVACVKKGHQHVTGLSVDTKVFDKDYAGELDETSYFALVDEDKARAEFDRRVKALEATGRKGQYGPAAQQLRTKLWGVKM